MWVSGIVLLPFLIAWCIQPFFCVGETPKDPLRFKRMTLTLKKEKEGTFSCCIEQRMQRIRFFRMLLQSVWKAEKLIWLGFSNCIWEFHAFWILYFFGYNVKRALYVLRSKKRILSCAVRNFYRSLTIWSGSSLLIFSARNDHSVPKDYPFFRGNFRRENSNFTILLLKTMSQFWR